MQTFAFCIITFLYKKKYNMCERKLSLQPIFTKNELFMSQGLKRLHCR